MRKNILILGAGSDMARALCAELAGGGYDLFLAGRNVDELSKDAKDLEIRFEIQAEVFYFDALDFDSHAGFYEHLNPQPYGVVVAFGLLGDENRARRDPQEWQRIINTNFTGCVSILSLAANRMEKAGEGFIVGISSVAGDRGRASNYVYGSAKAGMSAFLSGLRNRLFSSGVRVITVKPGFVRTKMTRDLDLPSRLSATPEEAAGNIYKAILRNRDIVYTRWMWRWIMAFIKHIPERIFKRMSI